MLFVYDVREEKDGIWSDLIERADYNYHKEGEEYFARIIHGKIEKLKRIRFGYNEPQFTPDEILNAIDYANEMDYTEEKTRLLRAIEEMGIRKETSFRL